MKLENFTEHFSYNEFFVTEIENTKFGFISDDICEQLYLLCVYLLEPIREYANEPIIITSGYRSYNLNLLVGGAPYSLHIFGKACDFTVKSNNKVKLLNIFNWARYNLEFSELILYDEHIHIGLPVWGKDKYIENKISRGGN